jgi:hypothetical protein
VDSDPCGVESTLQSAVMDPLSAFVAVASGGTIVLHDTHKRRFLAGLKPDITGTSTDTTSKDDVALVMELKTGDLKVPEVLGQIARYAVEVAKARAVDGPVTVAVMNTTHVLFLRVSDQQPSALWVSGAYHLLSDGEDGGVYRLLEYVVECNEHLQKQAATEWGRKYVPLRHLGSGVSARAHTARRRGAPAGHVVVIKVFNPSTDGTARDAAPSPSRDPSDDSAAALGLARIGGAGSRGRGVPPSVLRRSRNRSSTAHHLRPSPF